jgi:DNA-binding transcriptional LysR family regulator
VRGDVVLIQLEYLVSLARERHFGEAAKACNVSQPTLSVAIRRLERTLGVAIVLRGRRFDGFTVDGMRVVTWAHRILAERDELLTDVDRMRGRLTATARIGAIPTSAPASPLLTQRFLAQNPAATIRIDTLSSREIARRLAHFEIDAGLTYLDYETPPGYRRDQSRRLTTVRRWTRNDGRVGHGGLAIVCPIVVGWPTFIRSDFVGSVLKAL